ncbi:hypothetical protein [Arthrobacter sp. NPDC056493]|uniref:hypothetical protein n=1 Tax=Arthrobacter sp. NPDC056493 TaxID=3345839 RepID=UPI003672B754
MDDAVAVLAMHWGLVLQIALARHRALEAVPVIIGKDDVFVDERSGRFSDLHSVGQFHFLVCLFHKWKQQNGEQGNHNRTAQLAYPSLKRREAALCPWCCGTV